MKFLVVAVIYFFVVTVTLCAASEVVEFQSCNQDMENPPPSVCTIREVRIDPCLKQPCKVKRGKDVSIAFEFTPAFEATKLENDVFWASPEGDLPWEGLKKDACEFVTCPLKKDVEASYSYQVTIDKMAPPVSIFFFRGTHTHTKRDKTLCIFMSHMTFLHA